MTSKDILEDKIAILEGDLALLEKGDLGVNSYLSTFMKFPYRYKELVKEAMQADLAALKEEANNERTKI